MHKSLIIFFMCVIATCFIHVNADAVPSCPTDATNAEQCNIVTGCEWNDPVCTHCVDNYYYDTDKTCKSCPSSHPSSVAGSVNGQSDCYKTCSSGSVTGGTQTATSDKAYYPNDCSYTLTCNMGYYKSDNECKKCPYGSTCAAGAESINNCYFAAGTVFKDSNSNGSDRTYILPANAGLSNSLKNAN